MKYGPGSGEFYLLAAGVPEEELHDCLEWAFGKTWAACSITEFRDRWNKKHSDIFVIDKDAKVWVAITSVGMAYVEWKSKRSGGSSISASVR